MQTEEILDIETKTSNIIVSIRKEFVDTIRCYDNSKVEIPAYSECYKNPQCLFDTQKKLFDKIDKLLTFREQVLIVKASIEEQLENLIVTKETFNMMNNYKKKLANYQKQLTDYLFEITSLQKAVNSKITYLQSICFTNNL